MVFVGIILPLNLSIALLNLHLILKSQVIIACLIRYVLLLITFILLHVLDLGERVLLLLDYLALELISLLRLVSHLPDVLLPLILEHVIGNPIIKHLVFLLLTFDVESLILEVLSILVADEHFLLLILHLERLIHFILMLDDGGPLVVDHVLFRDGQRPLLGRTHLWLNRR